MTTDPRRGWRLPQHLSAENLLGNSQKPRVVGGFTQVESDPLSRGGVVGAAISGMVGGGGPLGPRLPLRPPGLGTFLCCCCGTAAAAGGGSRRTGRQDRDWEVGSVGLGPSRAAGSKGQRGSWLTVSPTQDEAAVPGGRALRRNPGRGSASAGPAQGERWARQGRTLSRARRPVTCGCTRPSGRIPPPR